VTRSHDGSLELWKWHDAVLTGNITAARKNCSLTMFNSEGKPVARYYLHNAWPSKMELAALKAGASAVLMETVTLVCESIQRVAP
jgi:phage tail-like protein